MSNHRDPMSADEARVLFGAGSQMSNNEQQGETRTFELTDAHVAEIELVTDLKGGQPPRVQMVVRWRPDRTLFIAVSPRHFVLDDPRFDVHDIRVGNRSQLAQPGALPGELFSSSAIGSFVSFDTLQTAMDFDVVVAYPYDPANPAIRPFRATLTGLCALTSR